jgi:hypothetical protein
MHTGRVKRVYVEIGYPILYAELGISQELLFTWGLSKIVSLPATAV